MLTVSGSTKARKKDSWGSGGGAGLDRHGNRGGIWLVAEENEEDAAAAEGMDGTNLLIFRVGP